MHIKRNNQQSEKITMEWEKIINNISDKWLMFRICKELSTAQQQNDPFKEWAKDLNIHFSKE